MDSLNLDSLLIIYERFFFVLNINIWLTNERFQKIQTHSIILLAFSVLLVCIFAILSQFFFNDGLPFFANNARFFTNFSEYIACMVAIIEFISKRNEIDEFWLKINEINFFVYRKLGYRIKFSDFLKTFLNYIGFLLFLVVSFICARLFIAIEGISMLANISTLSFRILFVYILSNVLFIVELFKYLNRLASKYIKCNYRQRESNILFVHTKCTILNDLKVYKQLHFILYEIVSNINRTFGLIFMAIFYVGFVNATNNVFFTIHHLIQNENKWILLRNS